MNGFRFDLRDLRFNLFECLDLDELLGHPHYAQFDRQVLGDVLDMACEQSAELLAPLSDLGDREGMALVDGRVRSPVGWKEAYDRYREAGWIGLNHGSDYGGMGFPHVLAAATREVQVAANISFSYTPLLTAGAIGLIQSFGNDRQRELYVPKMLRGEWSGTMCLTEAHAGTAVPDLRSRAEPVPDREGLYRITGQKVFITSGDHDLTDNIVHMVLARIDGAPPDHRGVSLFIVPVHRRTPDGTLAFNDVRTVGLEHKMGIHASPTVQLAFGDEGDCLGWLVGNPGEGLRYMFKLMNESRITVAVQSVGLASLAYQRALRYARERVQGTRIEEARKDDAERVPIVEHPDVRRMLMTMKAISEGARALVIWTSWCADRELTAADEDEARRWDHQLSILTPIAKAWCSDESFRVAELGVQVLGGYGYIREYGMEQIVRDAKIGSIYEGTNGVQALDLLGRKVARRSGVMLRTMLSEIGGWIDSAGEHESLGQAVRELARARDALSKASMDFARRMAGGDPLYGAFHATPYLQMFGDTVVGWLLLRQAVLADRMLGEHLSGRGLSREDRASWADDPEARFLDGKIATARFFVHQVMPRVHARHASIASGDRSALDALL